MSYFFRYLIVLIPVIFIICVVMVLITVFQETKNIGKARAWRDMFLTVTSFLSLLGLVGVVAFLLHIGFRTWIFPDAIYNSNNNFYLNTPPTLFYAPVYVSNYAPNCGLDVEKCPLAEEQKQSIEDWKTQYHDWKLTTDPSLYTRQDLIGSLSIGIVLLPLFLLSFLTWRKTRRDGLSQGSLVQLYYYGVSFIGLVIFLINMGLSVNVFLTTWLLPKGTFFHGTPFIQAVPITSVSEFQKSSDQKSVLGLPACVEKCGLSPEYKQLVEEWKQDYDRVLEKQKSAQPGHVEYATTLPLMLAGSGLFFWHFFHIRKQKNDGKDAHAS